MSNRFVSIKPPLAADVIFWGVDIAKAELQKDEGDKVKNFDIHPVQTWILSVDRNEDIYIWDYTNNLKLFHKPISQLLVKANSVSTSRQINMGITKTENISSRNDQTKKNKQTIPNCYQYGSFDSLFSDSLSHKTQIHTSMSRYYTNHAYNQMISGDYLTKPKLIPQFIDKYTSKEKEVKHLAFADASCLTNSTPNVYIPGVTTFNISSRILIVCDVGVLFIDFRTGVSNIITPSDLNNKIPSTAEFIFYDMCAIGCSDGVIRIWDCCRWAELKQLSAHVKGDIFAIKSLPILSKPSSGVSDDEFVSTYESHMSSVLSTAAGSVIREGRIRLLSIGRCYF